MSGIAELLANLGYEVSGSDARRSDVTDRLATLGVRIATGHNASNIGTADVVGLDTFVHVAQNCWDNLKSDERHAVFDFNHPLAGQRLRLEVQILGIL